jgi:putative glycosyltransferase (TIGR04348 family)
MKLMIVCPAPPGSRMGNRVTAVRWRTVLRSLGHDVRIVTDDIDHRCDALIALHARKSASAVFASKRAWPARPVVVALTGTDLYRDIRVSREAQEALARADRLVVLQSHGVRELPAQLRAKTRVIEQSCPGLTHPPRRTVRTFDACVIGHLRDEKDPLRAAIAVRDLPSESALRVVQAGGALNARWRRAAEAEMRTNPRYLWRGELSRSSARTLLARSHVMVLSSIIEGGANVISEAAVVGTAMVASEIPSSVALLGADHPGLFRAGDTAGLRALLLRCEQDARFLGVLERRSRALAPRFDPKREREAWRALLREIRG